MRRSSSLSGSTKDVGLALGKSASGINAAFSDRVRLYLKVTALINLFFATVAGLMFAAGLQLEEDTVVEHRLFVICSVTALNSMAWFAIARSRHSTRTALLTEAFGTLALATAYSYVAIELSVEPDRGDGLLALLLVTIILVLRSSLIPSPTVATLVIGLLCVAGSVAFAVRRLTHLDFIFHFWQGVLGVVIVAVTTVTSYTIYGLHRRMQAARRLGQYQLEERVGQGGMGEVYLAKHSLLHRQTAIKLLRDVTSGSARDRFRQEVQTASALTHPNTVEIYDYGRTPDGVFYFAMEYVEGASLEDLVGATGPMPAARVVRLLEQAAGSLSEAHRRGLVHRDVKPSNLMVCERGGDFDTLKVLDFGLVRDLSDDDSESDSALTGTPLYLAPEAILDEQGFVPESDVYALGATAYFLLTGEPPFSDGGLVDVLSDHLATEPREIECEDPVLAALVLRCLSKDPSVRPADGAEVLNALRSCQTSGEWTVDDAQVWWAEHREIVESRRSENADHSPPRSLRSRSQVSRSA